MKSFFESMTWPRSKGRLHVYAFANAPVAAMARAYHDVLADRGVTANLPRQPDEFLHVTIEQIQRYVDDMADDELHTLRRSLAEHIAAVPAFDLTIGPIGVEQHGIGLDAVPDEPWHHLRRAVRDAAVAALGDDAVKPLQGPGAPHVSVSYATGEVDIMPHLRDLLRVRPGRATLPVDEVRLVAVDQDPVAGVYSWPGTVATFPLGARR